MRRSLILVYRTRGRQSWLTARVRMQMSASGHERLCRAGPATAGIPPTADAQSVKAEVPTGGSAYRVKADVPGSVPHFAS